MVISRIEMPGIIFPSLAAKPVAPGYMRKDINITLAKAGINKIRFHNAGHTAATLLLNNNFPVIVIQVGLWAQKQV